MKSPTGRIIGVLIPQREHVRELMGSLRIHHLDDLGFVAVEAKPGESAEFGALEHRILETREFPPCEALACDPSWFRNPNDPSLLQEEREKKANPWYLREQRGGRKSKNRRW